MAFLSMGGAIRLHGSIPINMTRGTWALVLAVVVPAGCTAFHDERAKMPSCEQHPFDFATAPAILGRPGEAVESAIPFFTSAFWLVLRDRDGRRTSQVVVVEDGRIDLAHGLAAAARYLRRAHLEKEPTIDAGRLAYVLDQYGALPPGFTRDEAMAFHPITKETGGLTLTPFALKLISPGYEEPWPPPRDELPSDQPTPPPTGSGPVEGPAGPPPAQPAPPGAAGLRPFVPVARAILRGDETRHYVWTVELWDYDRNRWVEKHRIPLEP